MNYIVLLILICTAFLSIFFGVIGIIIACTIIEVIGWVIYKFK